MCPGIDGTPGTLDAAALSAESAGYARALLDRIGAGASSPDDLAALLQFLHSGPMLHGACAVLFLAMRLVAGRCMPRATPTDVQTPARGSRGDAR